MDTSEPKPGAHAQHSESLHLESSSEPMEEYPTDSPMTWPRLRKNGVLLQCSLHAMGPGFTSAILIPGVGQLAEQFQAPIQKCTYLIGVHVLFLGIGPFLWNPVMAIYGRRPVMVLSMFLSFAAALGGGFAETYASLMTARVFQSIGISSGLVVPGVVVVDLFTAEERGRKNGAWAQMVAIGAPLGGVIGGPIVYYAGWKWVLWVIAIFNAVETIGFLLTCPETSSVHREAMSLGAHQFSHLFRLPKRLKGVFSLRGFVEPIVLLRYWNITLIAFAYGVTFAITSPGISVIVPLALEETYGFSPVAQGAFFAGPLIGVALAELVAGRASDWAMNRERRRASQAHREERLESRLWVALPAYVLSPLGVIIFGVTLQKHTHWIGPCMGFAISNFGLQLATTPLKTYCVDCYAAGPGSVLQLINVIRQVISFTIPFWSPNLSAAVGYGLGFGIEAIILVVFYVLSGLVFWKGAGRK